MRKILSLLLVLMMTIGLLSGCTINININDKGEASIDFEESEEKSEKEVEESEAETKTEEASREQKEPEQTTESSKAEESAETTTESEQSTEPEEVEESSEALISEPITYRLNNEAVNPDLQMTFGYLYAWNWIDKSIYYGRPDQLIYQQSELKMTLNPDGTGHVKSLSVDSDITWDDTNIYIDGTACEYKKTDTEFKFTYNDIRIEFTTLSYQEVANERIPNKYVNCTPANPDDYVVGEATVYITPHHNVFDDTQAFNMFLPVTNTSTDKILYLGEIYLTAKNPDGTMTGGLSIRHAWPHFVMPGETAYYQVYQIGDSHYWPEGAATTAETTCEINYIMVCEYSGEVTKLDYENFTYETVEEKGDDAKLTRATIKNPTQNNYEKIQWFVTFFDENNVPIGNAGDLETVMSLGLTDTDIVLPAGGTVNVECTYLGKMKFSQFYPINGIHYEFHAYVPTTEDMAVR